MRMAWLRLLTALIAGLLSGAGCRAIEGIFKTGVGVGVFMSVLIAALVLVIVVTLRKG
jgi:hypothetical protein